MKRVELGCIGHFISGQECLWRRHTQVGHYRISSIGNYVFRGERQTLCAGDDSFFETMVFKTTKEPAIKNYGCGCKAVKSWSEVDSQRYATVGKAQAGHEKFVRKYMRGQR